MKSLSSVDSRPEDSSLLQTSPLLIENKRQPPDKMHNQVTETDTPILMDIRSFGNVDTFMPPPLPPAQYFIFFLSLLRTLKYFVQNPDSLNPKRH